MVEQKTTKAQDEKHKPLSRGEKIFDWLTYGGIAGVAVFVATIPVAYWLKYGGGAKPFHKATDWLIKKGFSKNTAEQTMMTTATMQGGNIMMLPVKWMEDNKIDIIKKIDSITGDKTDVGALEKEDKQTWGSILKARVLAWVSVFTGFKIAEHTIGVQKLGAFEESFAKKTCAAIGKPTHIGGQETKAFRLGRIGALDLFATTSACILLFLGTRFFAKKNKEMIPKEDACEVCAVETVQDTATHHGGKTIQSIISNKKQHEGFAASISHPSSLQLGA